MILEEQRILHEDLERLESAIADRLLEEPKHIRERLSRDHQISSFLERMREQSQRLLHVYGDGDGSRQREVQSISTGDTFDDFYKHLSSIRDFHKRYPNEPVENLERAYKRRAVGEAGEALPLGRDADNMFTGEEGFGRFFDLTSLHEDYVNLPGVKGARRVTYLQYLDTFDVFTPPQCPVKRHDKNTDAYFSYIGALSAYLESFMRRTRPLEDLASTFAGFYRDFEEAWERDDVPGWSSKDAASTAPTGRAAPVTEGTGEGIWCADCAREFKNDNVYKHHLTQKKHLKNAEARAARSAADGGAVATTSANGHGSTHAMLHRLKERALAEREFRVRKLASAMSTERSDTRVNVERKAGMTDRERQQELEALYAEAEAPAAAGGGGDESGDDEDKIYNPLKLPLAWDGKPIPFWLYKLHGLGVEFPCEICGNFVYMGRRAFDKHFSEARHVYGLKSLGVNRDLGLFREIVVIDDAIKLWEKVQRDRKDEQRKGESVVQMEDGEGNVMPEKVYWDLQKQGLL